MKNTKRKSESIARLTVLVFLGVAIQSLLLFTSVLDLIKNNNTTFFPLEFFIAYLGISFLYSVFTSVYVNPNMVVSPFYTQLGTVGAIVFIIIIHLVMQAQDIDNVIGVLIILGSEFGIFIIFGFFSSMFLRKMIGMNGEQEDIWNETYRVEADYKLVKKIFGDEYFTRYDLDESEEKNRITATRTYASEMKALLLLQTDPKSPRESILSISTCEIRFESIWKTENAKKRLDTIKRTIIGTLLDTYHIELVLDPEEKTVSSKCKLMLLESMESPLSKISKVPKKIVFACVGLISLGVIVTILMSPALGGIIPMDTSTLIVTWVTILTPVLYLSGSEIRTKFQKKF